jgi:hypothetical protein
MREIPKLPPLVCGSCRKCCEGQTSELVLGDDPSLFKTKLVDGKRVLKADKHGDCVYLGKSGCQIHQTKPTMCRAMDCRVYAIRRYGNPTNNMQARKVLAEGQRRLYALGLWPPSKV